MEEKVKVMVFFEVGDSLTHPRDLDKMSDIDAWKHLTTKENIVRIYLAQTKSEPNILGMLPNLWDFVEEFNNEEMDNGTSMWSYLLELPRKTLENYLTR